MGPERVLEVAELVLRQVREPFFSIYNPGIYGELCVGANPTLITIFGGVLSQFTIYRGS